MEKRLCRKDVRRVFDISRTQLWRWERNGLRFINGRITEAEVGWWHELADAARLLGKPIREVAALDRPAQGDIIARAFERRKTLLAAEE